MHRTLLQRGSESRDGDVLDFPAQGEGGIHPALTAHPHRERSRRDHEHAQVAITGQLIGVGRATALPMERATLAIIVTEQLAEQLLDDVGGTIIIVIFATRLLSQGRGSRTGVRSLLGERGAVDGIRFAQSVALDGLHQRDGIRDLHWGETGGEVQQVMAAPARPFILLPHDHGPAAIGAPAHQIHLVLLVSHISILSLDG